MACTARRILVICTDQHRWDALGCYGAGTVHTPNIDRLAADGAVFEQCYTVNPVCAPSRASMLTGTYPHQHGLWANGVRLAPEEANLIASVRDEGYRTGLVGKWHLTACSDGRPEEPSKYGFDWVRWAHDPRHTSPLNAYHGWLREHHAGLLADALAASERASDAVDPWDDDPPAGGVRQDATAFDLMPAQAHYTRWVAEEGLEFIDTAQAGQPWLLWLNFYDPHHPFVAPREYLERARSRDLPPPVGSAADLADRPARLADAARECYAGHARGFLQYTQAELAEARAAYFAMIDFIDEQVGRIVQAAERQGEPGELLVLFVSDHGEMLGDHGLILKGPMMYEGATRIPCIVRWPGQVTPGTRSAGFASLVDVAPTIAAAAGAKPPLGCEGMDLVSLAAGAPPRSYAFAEYRDSGHPYESPVWTSMVRDERFKMILWHGRAEVGGSADGELYDLASDPGELVNLWSRPDFAEVRLGLHQALADFLALPGREWGKREGFW